ncbi:MAG: hypothetical protein RL190_477 [Actinomycetota bacterium]
MDEAAIEAAANAAQALAGVRPQAVVPVDQPKRGVVFVCALPRGDDLGWVVVDGAGAPVTGRAAVRQIVELAAICEAAEESAAALAVDEALPALARAWELARELEEAEAELAAHAAYQAVEALQPLVQGLRVADPGYLDRLAQAAALVGDRFDLLKEAAGQVSARLTGHGADPLEPLATALWAAIRLLSRDGPPDRFREGVETAMGPAQAFADDVLARYLVPLDGTDDTGETA